MENLGSVNNRPRSIYQYSNMAPRLSGQTSIFGVVFFVSKPLLRIEIQKKLGKFAILTRKPRSHVRILIYRTWPIATPQSVGSRFSGEIYHLLPTIPLGRLRRRPRQSHPKLVEMPEIVSNRSQDGHWR